VCALQACGSVLQAGRVYNGLLIGMQISEFRMQNERSAKRAGACDASVFQFRNLKSAFYIFQHLSGRPQRTGHLRRRPRQRQVQQVGEGEIQ
jgi:hypothetical protein